MDVFFQHNFITYVLITAFFVSILCGCIGTFVVVNRMVFIAGGIAHAAYGGVGLAFFLGYPVVPTTFAFTLLISLIIAHLTYTRPSFSDSVIGLIWVGGMALGIILSDLAPGYNVDLMSYLFGNLLSVSKSVVIAIGIFSLFVIFFILFNYKKLWIISYDIEYAKTRGINVRFYYYFFVVLVGICVVLLIQFIGLLLVIALFSIPAFTSERFVNSFGKMMALSVFFSFLFCYLGIYLAFLFNLSSGASIILTGIMICFLANFLGKFVLKD